MKGGTTPVRLVWHNGRPFGALAKALVDYFQGKGVRLGLDPSGHGIFSARVHIPDQPFKYTDAPWDADPWLEPETLYISWRFLEADGTEWGWFYVKREQNQPLMPEGQPSAVYVMLLFFDGHLLSHRGESPEEFETLVRKYEQLKDIFKILDCDEVFAWDEMFVYDAEFQSHFPFERDKVFRFAKEGTQVLVKRLEERQMMSGEKGLILGERIFIDPPGVAALPLADYEQRWLEYCGNPVPKQP